MWLSVQTMDYLQEAAQTKIAVQSLLERQGKRADLMPRRADVVGSEEGSASSDYGCTPARIT